MNKQEADFAAAQKFLDAAQAVLLVSHEFTDGDELGAALALKQILSAAGKKVQVVAKGGVPDKLLFLPGATEALENLPPDRAGAALVFLGCGSADRSGFEELVKEAPKVLNIDHHPDNQNFGQVNLVDASAAATSQIVYRYLKFIRAPITKPVAINLLTGIFHDTGGFRHANTTAEIFEIAAELVSRGARIDRISDHYFGHSELPKLRAWARALENARFDPEKQMIYSIVTEEDLKEVNASSEDLEGLAEVLNTVPEAKFSMFLKQRGEEVKGSLRSEDYKGVDVSEIARSYGGGGHKLAAGFKLKGKVERTPDGWKIT
jgi:phosphoesterase RecJ-like protein